MLFPDSDCTLDSTCGLLINKMPSTILENFITLYPLIEFIHFHWVDLSGIHKSRVISRSRALKLASGGMPQEIGHGSSLGMCYSELPHGSWIPAGVDSLYPVWSSLRMMGENWCSVICCSSEESALIAPDLSTHDGFRVLKFERCPRSVLKKIITHIKEELFVTFLVGFELEFYLLDDEKCHRGDPNECIPVITNTTYNSTALGLRGSRGACVEECARKLQAFGIEVEQYHAESGPYQFEIATGPLPPLEAVDTLIQSQEIIRRIAINHGLRACFLPKPFRQYRATGLHAHLSLYSDAIAGNKYQDSFLAGVLSRLPQICAFSMASQQSYLRVEPRELGMWVSWGNSNRDTPIRRVSHNRFEFRAMDATSNPYLAIAAYISAGILGMEMEQELTWKDCKYFLDELTDDEREALGILVQVPGSLKEALDTLDQNTCGLERKLGAEMVHLYRFAKRRELAKLDKLGEANIQALYLTYF